MLGIKSLNSRISFHMKTSEKEEQIKPKAKSLKKVKGTKKKSVKKKMEKLYRLSRKPKAGSIQETI